LVEAGHSQCNNAGMVEKIISSSKWYYVLTFGLIINFFVVVILLVYIMRRRARKGSKVDEVPLVRNAGQPNISFPLEESR